LKVCEAALGVQILESLAGVHADQRVGTMRLGTLIVCHLLMEVGTGCVTPCRHETYIRSEA
jgi:hypothetical protein